MLFRSRPALGRIVGRIDPRFCAREPLQPEIESLRREVDIGRAFGN